MYTAPGSGRLAGLFQGPVVPPGGLTPAHADPCLWKKLWDVGRYDPDPLVAATTLMGAMASYQDELWISTMNVPMVATQMALQNPMAYDANGNGSLDPSEFVATVLGTHRATSLFRVRELDRRHPKFQLVYGELVLPKYEPAQKSYTVDYRWTHKNGMDAAPSKGASGYGKLFNAYTWSALVHRNELYLGTFDSSLMLFAALEGLAEQLGVPLPEEQLDELFERLAAGDGPMFGADLLRVTGRWGRVEAESLSGVGNYTSYGVRNMLSDGMTLYLGMANPANLHPAGGWELLRMMPRR